MTKIEELRQKLREKGIEFTEEELNGLLTKNGELSEEMLAQAAGGMTEEEFFRKLVLEGQLFFKPSPW